VATDLERMIVRLEASLTQFDRDMKRASGIADRSARQIETRFQRMNKQIGGFASAGVTKFAGAFVGMIGVQRIVQQTGEALNRFSEIAENAGTVGLTPEFYQTLIAAGQEYGASQEEITSTLNRFVASMGQAKEGVGPWVQSLKKTNPELLRQLQLAGNTEEALRILADTLSGIADADERAAVAKVLLGKTYAGFSRVLQIGSDGLSNYQREAIKTGRVIEGELIQKGDDIADAYARASDVLTNRWQKALVGSSPGLIRFTELMGDAAEAVLGFDNERLLAALQNQLEGHEAILERKKALIRLGGTAMTDEDINQTTEVKTLMESIEAIKKRIANIQLGELSFEGMQKLLNPPKKPPAPEPEGEPPDLAAAKAAATLAEKAKDAQAALEDKAEAARTDAAALFMGAEAGLAYKTELETINSLTRDGITITPELAARVRELSRDYAEAATQSESLAKAQQFFEDAAGGALKTFVQGLREGKTAMEALEAVLEGLADKLIDLALNLAIAGISKGIGAAGGFNAIAPAFVQHAGGPAGTGPTRNVPMSVFADAPRLHRGGYIGAGEIPAILQRGETVIPRGGRMGSETNVVINNYSNEGVEKKERENSTGGMDIEVMIGNIVSKQIATPGSAPHRTLGAVFGMKPVGVRR
jgi:hypothetical protein